MLDFLCFRVLFVEFVTLINIFLRSVGGTMDKLCYDLYVTLDKLRSLDKTKEASFLYFDFSAFVNKFSRL